AIGLTGAGAAIGFWPASIVRRLPSNATWVAFYGEHADLSSFDGYDVVVLDPRFKGDVAALTARPATTLGYLSLGAISNQNPAFSQLTDPAALLHENPNWPGTFSVDARRPAWERLILQDIVPEILGRGFTGVFIDTVDSLVELENKDVQAYRGM